jgi:hypothetical protein
MEENSYAVGLLPSLLWKGSHWIGHLLNATAWMLDPRFCRPCHQQCLIVLCQGIAKQGLWKPCDVTSRQPCLLGRPRRGLAPFKPFSSAPTWIMFQVRPRVKEVTITIYTRTGGLTAAPCPSKACMAGAVTRRHKMSSWEGVARCSGIKCPGDSTRPTRESLPGSATRAVTGTLAGEHWAKLADGRRGQPGLILPYVRISKWSARPLSRIRNRRFGSVSKGPIL